MSSLSKQLTYVSCMEDEQCDLIHLLFLPKRLFYIKYNSVTYNKRCLDVFYVSNLRPL